MVNQSEAVQVLMVYYQNARAEMLQRNREREVATYAWITAVGAALSLTSAGKAGPEPLLILPLVALALGARIAQHEALIRKLADYCESEITPALLKYAPDKDLVHWDESKTLKQYQKTAVSIRGIVNVLLFVGPSVVVLVLNARANSFSSTPMVLTWCSGLLCTAATLILLVGAMLRRLSTALRGIIQDERPG